MASGKKFLSPVLYPKDFSLEKHWFIKYQVQDWVAGGFKYEKYTGLLNRVDTVEERLKMARAYLAKMKAGEPLDNYQGLRTMPASPIKSQQDSNVIICCKNFLSRVNVDVETGERKPATYTQYKTKINAFIKWLQNTGKDHLAIGGLSDDDCYIFLTYLLTEKKLCNETYNAYKSLLGSIWEQYKKQLKGANPWRDIKPRKKKTKHLESYPMVLQKSIEDKLPDYNKQLWLFVQCIYYCGIRPSSELRFLQVKHLDIASGLITVPSEVSKNGKERRVNIFKGLLSQFIELQYHLKNPCDYLFTVKGEPGPLPASKNFFSRKWSKFRMDFNIDPVYKMYGSKHTAGKSLSKKTNPYITKEHFDHQSLATTQSYIGNIDKNELHFLQTDFPEFAKP